MIYSMHKGFVAILFLVLAVLGTAAIGGVAYVATHQKDLVSQEDDTSTQEVSLSATTTATTEITPPTTPPASTLTLGELYITPGKTPTIKMPKGWNVNVIYDEPLKQGDTMQYRTLVVFSNAEKSRVITYQLLAATPEQIDESSSQKIAEWLLGVDSYTTEMSVTRFTQSGFTGTELTYKNPTLKVRQVAPGEVEVRSDTVTYGIPLTESPRIVARVSYIPGFIFIVTGASTKESSTEMLNGWYKDVFASVTLPSPFNAMPRGIPIANFMQMKSKFAEVEKRVEEARALPKGSESDFTLSRCWYMTADMSIGDTDHSTNGEVSQLQKMLFEKYAVPGTVTGIFDDLTLIYAIRFQREMGLEGSGGIGIKSRSALNRCKVA